MTGPEQHLACLEVRGGNEPADATLAVPGLEIYVLSRPHRDAAGGGDVHLVSSCGTGRITRMLLADVSGHGPEVADTARVLRDLMRRHVNHIDPRRMVTRLNDQFAQLNLRGRFATAVVATYFAPTRRLEIVNAGHPPPLLFRRGEGWRLLKDDATVDEPRNLPLGVFEQMTYEQTATSLSIGDALLCYTDSVSESFDEHGEELGPAGLVRETHAFEPEQATAGWVSRWLDRIGGFSPENLQKDDLTVVLIRCTGHPQRAPLGPRLLGMMKTLLSPFTRGPMSLPELSVRNLGGSLLHSLSRWGRRRS